MSSINDIIKQANEVETSELRAVYNLATATNEQMKEIGSKVSKVASTETYKIAVLVKIFNELNTLSEKLTTAIARQRVSPTELDKMKNLSNDISVRLKRL